MNEYLVPSKCPKFYVPSLNEKIIKTKSVHHYSRSIDKRCFDFRNVVLKVTATMVDISNLCLKPIKNEMILSKDVIVKTIDAITLLGKENQQMTFERKRRLKNVLSEDYKTILNNCLCDKIQGYTFYEPAQFK